MNRLLTTPITKDNYKWLLTQPLFQPQPQLAPRIVRWTEITVLPIADEDVVEVVGELF